MHFLSRFVQSVSAESELQLQEKQPNINTLNQCDWLTSHPETPRSRSFAFFLFRGILTFLLIVIAHDALNASTGTNGTSDYFHWLLKKKPDNENTPSANESRNQTETRIPPPIPIQAASIASSQTPFVANPPQPKPRLRVVIERIHRNDTYANLMQRQHIPEKITEAFALKAQPIFNLHQSLKIDTPVKLTFNQDNQLIGFSYPISREQTLRITLDSDQQINAFLEPSHLVPSAETTATNQTSPMIEGNQLEEEDLQTNDEFAMNDESAMDDEIMAEDDDNDSLPAPNAHPKEITSNKTNSNELITKEVTIRPGDTLSSLLARRHISNLTSLQISKAAKPVFDLARQLSPGKTMTLSMTANGELSSLVYPIDHERTFWINQKNDNQFTAKIEKNPLEVRLESIDGTIHHERSLFVAAKHGGLSQSQAIKLSGLFEWDIDFAHDLHSGDHFTIVQEGLFSKGKRVRDGDIVAAEFTNRGKLFRAVRYIDPKGNVGYYDKNGNNIRKMFIRAPMDFTRISSHFSSNRQHPVFGFNRAHKGVDYAAPQGTPVRASGDGVVDYIGYSNGFGKLITVRHNNKYSTAYAHLNSFTSGLRKGSRIRQGAVIGRVGATGTATGPHLHYEVRVNGEQVNPLSIQLPSSGPVSNQYLADFRNQSNQLMALLKKRKSGDITHLASLLLPNMRTQAR